MTDKIVGINHYNNPVYKKYNTKDDAVIDRHELKNMVLKAPPHLAFSLIMKAVLQDDGSYLDQQKFDKVYDFLTTLTKPLLERILSYTNYDFYYTFQALNFKNYFRKEFNLPVIDGKEKIPAWAFSQPSSLLSNDNLDYYCKCSPSYTIEDFTSFLKKQKNLTSTEILDFKAIVSQLDSEKISGAIVDLLQAEPEMIASVKTKLSVLTKDDIDKFTRPNLFDGIFLERLALKNQIRRHFKLKTYTKKDALNIQEPSSTPVTVTTLDPSRPYVSLGDCISSPAAQKEDLPSTVYSLVQRHFFPGKPQKVVSAMRFKLSLTSVIYTFSFKDSCNSETCIDDDVFFLVGIAGDKFFLDDKEVDDLTKKNLIADLVALATMLSGKGENIDMLYKNKTPS